MPLSLLRSALRSAALAIALAGVAAPASGQETAAAASKPAGEVVLIPNRVIYPGFINKNNRRHDQQPANCANDCGCQGGSDSRDQR